MNRRAMGQIRSTTRVYMSVWAGDLGTVGQGFNFNISVMPQAFLKYDQQVGIYFTPRNLFGNDEFVSVAFDVSALTTNEQLNLTLVSGPECNNEQCRLDTPREFFDKTLVTYASATSIIPGEKSFTLRNYDRGVQTIPFSDMLTGEMRRFDTLFMTMQYRLAAKLN